MKKNKKNSLAPGASHLGASHQETKSIFYPMTVEEILAIDDIKKTLNLGPEDDIPPSEYWPDYLRKKYDW